jgi:two-component system, response regulator PdtaR
LLADDDRLVLATLTEGLRRAGYTVLDAAGGDEAIRLACEHKPDLAILDMRMPGRDGLAVARWLCEHTDCPFLFLSAYGDTEVVSAAVQAGALGYLVKPLDVQQILPSIEAALNRGRELRALLEEEAQLSAACAWDARSAWRWGSSWPGKAWTSRRPSSACAVRPAASGGA